MSLEKLIYLILMFFLFYSLYLYNENIYLNYELEHYKEKIASLYEDMSSMNKSLNFYKKQNHFLTEKLFMTKNKLKEINTSYNNLKIKYEENMVLLDKVKSKASYLDSLYKNLTNSIEDSLEWLRDNSMLNSPSVSEELSYCKEDSYFNYPCFINLLNENKKLSYEYEYNDKLKSLNELLSDGKGDCEDFSLLAMSLLNKLKDSGTRRLALYEYSQGEEFNLYEKGGYIYYLPDAKKVYKPIKNSAVVCYITNPINYEGHCIVSVYTKEIGDGYFFEPQTGELLENNYTLCRDGEGDCMNKVNKIFLVFDKEDMRIFTNENRWLSFKDLDFLLKKLKEEIEEIRKM